MPATQNELEVVPPLQLLGRVCVELVSFLPDWPDSWDHTASVPVPTGLLQQTEGSGGTGGAQGLALVGSLLLIFLITALLRYDSYAAGIAHLNHDSVYFSV